MPRIIESRCVTSSIIAQAFQKNEGLQAKLNLTSSAGFDYRVPAAAVSDDATISTAGPIVDL
jgi:hypothetical protein